MLATGRGKTTLPVQERLALWKFFYEVHMAGSASTSAVALSAAAYFPPSTRSLLAGAAAVYSTGALTLLFLLFVNNGLGAMLQSTSLKPMDPIQEKHALVQLDKWRAMHRVRIVLGTITWSTATIVMLATDSIFSSWFAASQH
ncbi:hypothetical protein C8R44DRAFT_869551 [Mycena epipterygia]|nr:hypothetical protein C8R44DRAFT_869551 [Mycena epipterygia]